MTMGEYLDLVRKMPVASIEALTEEHPFVVLSPHPDDETLGAGGLIAQACARDIGVAVAVLTDGSGSHPRSKRYPRERLIALRRAEVEKAASILGLSPADVHHLGLCDTAAPTSGPAFDAATAHIIEIIDSIDARALFVTWEYDGHRDHGAAAKLAKALTRSIPRLSLWAYPIWGWHIDPAAPLHEPAPRGVRLDIADEAASKRAAIAAHASQMSDLIDDDSEGFRFTDVTLAPFLGPFEYFIRAPQ